MSRIPEADLARWKSSADLLALMREDGMEFKRSGKDSVCLCPFHDDAKPSLRVTPKGASGKACDLWNCPACHTGGDALQWLVKKRKLSFRAAVETLRDRAGASAAGGETLTGRAGLACPLLPDMAKAQMLSTVLGYYHERLIDLETGAPCLAYLAKRGLDDANLRLHFGLGFADRTLGLRLPTTDGKAGVLIRVRLSELGLYRAQTMREHLNGCLVVPMRDPLTGEPVKAYGRILKPDPRRHDGAKHLYLPGQHAGVLNPQGYALAASPACGHLVLCESPIDAMTLWVNGIQNVCSAWGTNGFTADHLRALKEAQVKEVRIAFDRDKSGEIGAREVAEKLRLEGIACYRVELPRGLDVNAYAMNFADREERGEALKQAIRGASFIQGSGGILPPKSPPLAPAMVEVKAQVSVTKPAASSSLAAPSVAPAMAAAGFEITHTPDFSEVVATVQAERIYRVRGLQHNTGPERLKVTVKVWRKSAPEVMHADALDLGQARARGGFVAETAREIGESDGVIKSDIAKLFGALEAMRDALIALREQPKAQLAPIDTMNEEDKAQALGLLRSPNLMGRILEDFAACGVVGEETNKLVGYLAATSRLLKRPLAVVVQSSSAAGKTSLLDAVLAMMPDEAQVRYSAMTGQSLYYMGGDSLKHKILAIAEEEGAEQASYSLKLLQSEGKLAIATPSKDVNGQIKTERYEVEGPAAIFLTTTAADVDEELLNRCLVLTVDEDREQTRKIHDQQRKAQTLEGLKAQVSTTRILRLHQNAQLLLETVRVVNPFALKLTFLDGKTRARRDHPKYLSLIQTITLLHQHQRPRLEHVDETTGEIVEYIEATKEDIQAANRLMGEVLGRSLDELPPQTRRLLGLIEAQVKEGCKALGVKRHEFTFTRRDVREKIGWGNTQTKMHMMRLEEMEYLAVRRRGPLMLYELVYDSGQVDGAGGKFFPGLFDPGTHTCDGERSGVNEVKSAPGRPQVGAVSGGGRGEEKAKINGKTRQIKASKPTQGANENKAHVSTKAVVDAVVEGGEAQIQDQEVKDQDPRARSLKAALLAADAGATDKKSAARDPGIEGVSPSLITSKEAA